MSAVIAIGSVIASAIATAAAAIVAVVSTVIAAITSAVAVVASYIAAGVSAVVSGVTAAVGSVASSVAGAVSSVTSSIGATLSSWAGTITSYAKSIYAAWQTFAEAIHLKTILTIHKIAYLVSEDYRKMMNKVYGQIAEVSESIGLGVQFMNLALQNARSIVMDMSAIMGKSYDLGEITWLKSLNPFLKKFQEKATSTVTKMHLVNKWVEGKWKVVYESYEEYIEPYKNNPGELFNDINNWLIRDSVDAGSGAQRTMFTTMQSVTETLNETVGDVVTLRDDLDKFVSDLPKEIRQEVKPYIDPITDKVDGFLKDDYRPFKNRMDKIINVLDNKQATIKNRTDSIVDRLTRPGDVLQGVDGLPVDERIKQENKVSEVAARSNERQADNLAAQAQPTWEHLEKLRLALEERPPPPEYEVAERKKPVVPAGQQAKKADTWFVGDY